MVSLQNKRCLLTILCFLTILMPILRVPSSNIPHHFNLLHNQHENFVQPKLMSDYVERLDQAKKPTESLKWSPVVYEKCDSSWMPNNYAPCLFHSRDEMIESAHEIVYPDFELRLPNFLNTTKKEKWLSYISNYGDRLRYEKDTRYAIYAAQHGQVIMFKKGQYTNLPPPTWISSNTCMSKYVSHKLLRKHSLSMLNETNDKKINTLIIIATVPDGNYFQHFLDRVTHLLVQSEYILQAYNNQIKTIKIYLGNEMGKEEDISTFMISILKQFYNSSILLTNPISYSFSTNLQDLQIGTKSGLLVFPCRTPLIHPYLSIRFLELLNLDLQETSNENRSVLLYLKRHSNIRRVQNEGELLTSIRQLLIHRKKNERLVVFDHTRFNTFQETASWVRGNVKAIIGPHGGAWYNHRWALRDTLLIEFIPEKRFSIMFWEEAMSLGQNYWPVISKSQNIATHDMIVPISETIYILKKELSRKRSYRQKETVKRYYQWDVNSR